MPEIIQITGQLSMNGELEGKINTATSYGTLVDSNDNAIVTDSNDEILLVYNEGEPIVGTLSTTEVIDGEITLPSVAHNPTYEVIPSSEHTLT